MYVLIIENEKNPELKRIPNRLETLRKIVGNEYIDVIKYKDVLINMNNTLSKRGPDEEGYYINENVGLSHKRLIVIDPKGRKTTNDRKIFFW